MEKLWLGIGFVGQMFFTMRFLVQWVYSEMRKKSIIPTAFWYLSIVGSSLLLAYAFYRKDPVFILGYLFNSVVYIRNLVLIKNEIV